jgi:hypothetical protein
MNKQFYIDIKTRLETELGASVKTVGLFNNQFNNESTEKAFDYPAIFIEFSSVPYTTEGFGIQKGEIEFILHIGSKDFRKDINFLDLTQNAYLALQGFSGDYFNSINRIFEEQDTDHDSVLVWQITFNCLLTDCLANKWDKLTEKPAPTTLVVQRDLDIDNDVVRTGDGDD